MGIVDNLACCPVILGGVGIGPQRAHPAIPDAKLATRYATTVAMVNSHGQPRPETVKAFLDAAYKVDRKDQPMTLSIIVPVRNEARGLPALVPLQRAGCEVLWVDGGYVLLGLNPFDASVFSGIAWSTDNVASATLRRLAQLDGMLLMPFRGEVEGYAINRRSGSGRKVA